MKTNFKNKVLAIIPAYNEERQIGRVVRRISSACPCVFYSFPAWRGNSAAVSPTAQSRNISISPFLHPEAKSEAKILMSPFSAYDNSLLGSSPYHISWKSSEGNSGKFSLLQNGKAQGFIIPLNGKGNNGFIHVSCTANCPGHPVEPTKTLPKRSIVSFLEVVGP